MINDIAQRRNKILGDFRQLEIDAAHWNAMNPDKKPLVVDPVEVPDLPTPPRAQTLVGEAHGFTFTMGTIDEAARRGELTADLLFEAVEADCAAQADGIEAVPVDRVERAARGVGVGVGAPNGDPEVPHRPETLPKQALNPQPGASAPVSEPDALCLELGRAGLETRRADVAFRREDTPANKQRFVAAYERETRAGAALRAFIDTHPEPARVRGGES